nr:MAG TPA: hypothetical protein [Caudoviricetes sp.]DAY63426.1 MAG TPA: hypothetical protein [Caudoviricetes sp.]
MFGIRDRQPHYQRTNYPSGLDISVSLLRQYLDCNGRDASDYKQNRYRRHANDIC